MLLKNGVITLLLFECKDNIEGPNGIFIAGDFMNYSCGSYGYMRKII
jgi:hypothetical protein